MDTNSLLNLHCTRGTAQSDERRFLAGKLPVITSSPVCVCTPGIAQRPVGAKPHPQTIRVNLDAITPLLSVVSNALHPQFVLRQRGAVHHVLAMSADTKVVASAIQRISVSVIHENARCRLQNETMQRHGPPLNLRFRVEVNPPCAQNNLVGMPLPSRYAFEVLFIDPCCKVVLGSMLTGQFELHSRHADLTIANAKHVKKPSPEAGRNHTARGLPCGDHWVRTAVVPESRHLTSSTLFRRGSHDLSIHLRCDCQSASAPVPRSLRPHPPCRAAPLRGARRSGRRDLLSNRRWAPSRARRTMEVPASHGIRHPRWKAKFFSPEIDSPTPAKQYFHHLRSNLKRALQLQGCGISKPQICRWTSHNRSCPWLSSRNSRSLTHAAHGHGAFPSYSAANRTDQCSRESMKSATRREIWCFTSRPSSLDRRESVGRLGQGRGRVGADQLGPDVPNDLLREHLNARHCSARRFFDWQTKRDRNGALAIGPSADIGCVSVNVGRQLDQAATFQREVGFEVHGPQFSKLHKTSKAGNCASCSFANFAICY